MSIQLDAVQLFAIQDSHLEAITPQGLNLIDLTNDLQGEGAFELALTPDSTVLVRDPQAYVFALIEYSDA
jgi:hypothetical protein